MPDPSARPRRDQHVGLLVNSFAGGGAERAVLTIAGAWPADIPVTLVVARLQGPLKREAPVPTVELDAWPSPRSMLPFLLRLRRAVMERRLTVLVAVGFGLTHLALVAKALGLVGPARVIVVEQTVMTPALLVRYRSGVVREVVRRISAWLYRRADAIVAVSSGAAMDLSKQLDLPLALIATINNPVDVHRVRASYDAADASSNASPLPERFARLGRPIVLSAGRLVEEKAHRDLLEAFARLPDRHRGSLVILGEGPLRDDLQHHAEQLGITDHLWMPGFVDNPWWFIHRADLFCLPSHHEGHPLALLEALACRVPIIATDCPSGPREILGDLPGTRLVPVADPHALTAAITETLDTPIRPDADLTPYTPTHIARQYADLIDQLSPAKPPDGE